MKLSEYAKKIGVTYRTAFSYFKNNQIDGAYQLPTGTIVVPEPKKENQIKEEYNIIYARVSNSENKSNLDSQAERLTHFCEANGWVIHEIVKECASGLNDKRPKLIKILEERKATKLIVEHSDRLTRFGLNYIKVLYPECEIIIVNEVEDEENDLMQDFVSLVTCFCARLYGQRRSKRKTKKIIEELNKEE